MHTVRGADGHVEVGARWVTGECAEQLGGNGAGLVRDRAARAAHGPDLCEQTGATCHERNRHLSEGRASAPVGGGGGGGSGVAEGGLGRAPGRTPRALLAARAQERKKPC